MTVPTALADRFAGAIASRCRERRQPALGTAPACFSLLAGALLLASLARADVVYLDRPEDMGVLAFRDIESDGDGARILYTSSPTLPQGQADPDGWSFNVYVVEVTADGPPRQRRVLTRHEYFEPLSFQHGRDGFFIVRSEGGAALELRSTVDGELRRSVTPPDLPDEFGRAPLNAFTPTAEGNLAVTASRGSTGRAGDRDVELLFATLSPDGRVAGYSTWQRAGVQLMPGSGLAGRGAGFALTMRMIDDSVGEVRGLDTDIDVPIRLEVGGREILGRVYSETRLVAFDADGRRRWSSPALIRDIAWGGDIAIPQDLTFSERNAQNAEQMRLTQAAAVEANAQRSLGGDGTEPPFGPIKRTPAGYAALLRQTANRRLEPPVHGTYFVELNGDDGSLRREIRLESMLEEWSFDDVQDFVVAPDDGLVLLGTVGTGPRGRRVRKQMTRTSADGRHLETRLLPPELTDTDAAGLVRAGNAVWAVGVSHAAPSGAPTVWLQRYDDTLEAYSLDAAQSSSTQRPQAASESAARASDAGEDSSCSCSCEQFAEIQRLMSEIRQEPTPEQMRMLTCAGSCAAEFVSCALGR